MLDDRTEKYFKKVGIDLKYLGYSAGWDSIKEILKKDGTLETANLERINVYDGYANSSNIQIYRYNNGKEEVYCAELSYQTAIDDYCIETHFFAKLPTRNDIITVRTIFDAKFDMKFNGLNPEFHCWECGKMIHWLDCDGAIKQKFENLKERYCGC